MEDRLDVGVRYQLHGSLAGRVAGLLFALSLAGCQVYSADPISGRVVDKATGEPIEGVVVVAAWIPTGGPEGNNPQGLVHIVEAVTDAKGEYAIPGWGPKPYFGLGRLGINSPQMLFFKYGFDVEVGGEWTHWKTSTPAHTGSTRDGTVIQLVRSRVTAAEYASGLISIDIRIVERLVKAGGCVWQRVPHLLGAVDAAHARLRASGVSYIPVRTLDHLQLDVSCGNVKAFVAEKTR